MRYKHQRCMHFQDFKELVMFIEDLTGKDIVLEFENKMPGYFTTSRDKVMYIYLNLDSKNGSKLTGITLPTRLSSC